jgi:hypothetical protein
MQKQVSQTVKAGYFHLKKLSQIRPYNDLSKHLWTCAKVLNATVTSRLDFQNALLAGAHQATINPLQ